MPFESISYKNFRNIEDKSFDFSSGENFFIGINGQGKSNILESLYVLAYGNSFRTKSDSELIKFGESFYSLKTVYKINENKTCILSVSYDGKKKRIEKNGKKIIDRKEILSIIPCIIFSHEDMDFVIGEPEKRRFFFDQTLSLYDILYIDILRKYKKILRTRNLILKEHRFDLLGALDIQLAEAGFDIQKMRQKIISEYNVYFSDLYRQISGIENVTIKYLPSWKAAKSADEVVEILGEKQQIDIAHESTMYGPHRDRIYFVQGEKNFVPNASTGQRRILALLLRIIQAKFYFFKTNRNPILLFDDVLLELDQAKRNLVMQLLPKYDQLFCTFLPTENFTQYQKTSTKIWQISNGSCVKANS